MKESCSFKLNLHLYIVYFSAEYKYNIWKIWSAVLTLLYSNGSFDHLEVVRICILFQSLSSCSTSKRSLNLIGVIHQLSSVTLSSLILSTLVVSYRNKELLIHGIGEPGWQVLDYCELNCVWRELRLVAWFTVSEEGGLRTHSNITLLSVRKVDKQQIFPTSNLFGREERRRGIREKIFRTVESIWLTSIFSFYLQLS